MSSSKSNGVVMLPNHSYHSKTPFRPFEEVRPHLDTIGPCPERRTQFNVATMISACHQQRMNFSFFFYLITHYMSAGVKTFYRKINACAPCDNANFSDSKGNLVVDDKLPLLGGRFKHISMLGRGTFSQLVEAEDTFHPSKRRVAIKVMNIKYADVGIQESKCITFLNSTDTLDSTHIVRMFSTFFFGYHFCVVLELLHSNLIEHILAIDKRRKPQLSAPLLPPKPPSTPTKKEKLSKKVQELNDTAEIWKPTHEKRKARSPSQDESLPVAKKDKKEDNLVKASPHKERPNAKRGSEKRSEPPPSPSRQPMQQQQNTSLQQLQQAVSHQDNADVQQPLLPMWFIRSVASQLIAAVGYLYQKGMLHSDLKPENIMFRDNPYINGEFREPYLKIADFGNAIALGNIDLYFHNFEVQSLSYRAPEVICGVPFGLEIDMWSIGCILAEMCNGKLLFPYQDKRQLLHRMTRMFGALPGRVYSQGKFYSELFAPNCSMCKNTAFVEPDPFLEMRNFLRTNDFLFVDLVYNYDPKKRPTPQQALQHPFFAPLFTFSIFGDARVGMEIRRIHHSVNAKAMKIHNSANSQKTTGLSSRKGCILLSEDTKEQEEEGEEEVGPRTVPRSQLERSLERSQRELADRNEDIRNLNGKVFDYAKETAELRAEIAELSKSASKKRLAEQEKEIKRLRAELEKREDSSDASKEMAGLTMKYRAAVAENLDKDLKYSDDKRELQKEVDKLRVATAEQSNAQRKIARDLEMENTQIRGEMADLEKAKETIAARVNEREGHVLGLEEEIATLRLRVSEWNDEKVKLAQRETASLKKVAELERETKRLRVHWNTQDEEKAKLVTRESAAQRQITNLQKQLHIAEEEHSAAFRELAAKLTARDADAERTHELERLVHEIKKQLSSTEDDWRDAQAQSNSLRARIEQAEADAQSARAETVKLREENKTLRSHTGELESLKKELSKKGNEVTSLRSKVAEVQNSEVKAVQEKEVTAGKLQQAMKESEAMKAKLAEREADKKANAKAIIRLQMEVAEKDAELKKLRDEKTVTSKNYAEANITIGDLQIRITMTEEEKRKKEVQVQEAQQENEQLIQEQKTSQKELTRLTTLVERIEAELKALQAAKEKLAQQMAEKESQAASANEKLGQIKEENTEMKRTMEEEREEWQQKIDKLSQKQLESEEKVHLLQDEMARKEREFREKLDSLSSPPRPSSPPQQSSPTPITSPYPSTSMAVPSPNPSPNLRTTKSSSSPASIISPTPPHPAPHRPTPSRPPPLNLSNRTPSTSPLPPPRPSLLGDASNIFFQPIPSSSATPKRSAGSKTPRLVPDIKKDSHSDAKKIFGQTSKKDNADDVLFL